MPFQIKTDFENLDAAIAYLKGDITTEVRRLEGEVGGFSTEKAKLIAKRDELLGEAKTLKEKYAKFKGHEDVDIDELLRIKEQAADGESDAESKYRKLYEADQKKFSDRLAALEKERQEEKEQAEIAKQKQAQAQLKAEAIAEFAKATHGIISPNQFWGLYGAGVIKRDEESDKIIAEVDYKKMTLPEYVKYLADDPENQHHFKPSGRSGSGGGPGQRGSGKQKKWGEMSLTEKTKLIKSNPDQARKLASDAGETLSI
jgi:hypothetical protein